MIFGYGFSPTLTYKTVGSVPYGDWPGASILTLAKACWIAPACGGGFLSSTIPVRTPIGGAPKSVNDPSCGPVSNPALDKASRICEANENASGSPVVTEISTFPLRTPSNACLNVLRRSPVNVLGVKRSWISKSFRSESVSFVCASASSISTFCLAVFDSSADVFSSRISVPCRLLMMVPLTRATPANITSSNWLSQFTLSQDQKDKIFIITVENRE